MKEYRFPRTQDCARKISDAIGKPIRVLEADPSGRWQETGEYFSSPQEASEGMRGNPYPWVAIDLGGAPVAYGDHAGVSGEVTEVLT